MDQIKSILDELSVPWGISPIKLRKIGINKKILRDDLKYLIVILLPYYTKSFKKGNISRYATCTDYHLVAMKMLDSVIQELVQIKPENIFLPFCDNSPFDEVKAAEMAGLGCVGQNGLLISPIYGSYVFIAEIATDLEFNIQFDRKSDEVKTCVGCGKCVLTCPTKSLQRVNGEDKYTYSNCISEITQRKGIHTQLEIENIKKSGMVWGCDICQDKCPMNLRIQETPIEEFKKNIINNLEISDLNGLNEKEFRKKYSDRVFNWRGIDVLKRNLTY